jgi:hypothetical protein
VAVVQSPHAAGVASGSGGHRRARAASTATLPDARPARPTFHVEGPARQVHPIDAVATNYLPRSGLRPTPRLTRIPFPFVQP